MLSHVGIIPRFAESLTGFSGPELEVGHVDVDQAVHELEGLHGVVGARIVDDGDAEALLGGHGDGLNHLGRHVLWGDEVDVVALGLVLQLVDGNQSIFLGY